MSERDMALQLLNNLPQYKLGYVIAYMQGLAADEAADDAFCEKLCDEYESSSEKGQFVSMKEMLKLCGADADEV